MNNVSNPSKLAEDEFVVARISGMKIEDDVRYYLIEWEGYDLRENTWEEEDNVYSAQTIQRFIACYQKQVGQQCNVIVTNIQKKILLYDTYDPDTKSYFSSKSDILENGKHDHKKLHSDLFKRRLPRRSHLLIETSGWHQKQKTRTDYDSWSVVKHLKQNNVKTSDIEKLGAIEEFTNTIKDSVQVNFPIVGMKTSLYENVPLYHIQNLKTRITIWNEIDFDLPSDFIYIDDLKYTDPVVPPDQNFLSGCPCSYSADCNLNCHDCSAYDDSGRIIINQGTAIYECNSNCECGINCKNRVVQRGRKIPLQIFKTFSKGWGVRSTQFIPKGTYVEQYIGEVITVEEGDARGAFYDRLGCSYLFDMDFAQSELPTKYVIDSFVVGNVSRFFNHSCSPNLEVFAVFYDSADNQLHRLAFFAKRDVEINEELCFDYNGRWVVSERHNLEGARYLCHCGSIECRKWIYQ